jgi:hypothetical protein
MTAVDFEDYLTTDYTDFTNVRTVAEGRRVLCLQLIRVIGG